MKTIKKILHIKLTIIVLLLLPFVIFTLITSKTPLIGGIQSFVVLTGSMQPTIPAGSIVFTQKATYQKNDVIAFQQGNVTITHRIVGVKKEENQLIYATKGDANKTVDETFVSQKDILGKTIFSIPYIGKFVLFLKTLPGFALFIIFPTIFFITFELNAVRKEIIKQAERKAMEKMKTI